MVEPVPPSLPLGRVAGLHHEAISEDCFPETATAVVPIAGNDPSVSFDGPGLLHFGKRKKPKPKAAATTLRLGAAAYADAESQLPAPSEPYVHVPGLPAGLSSRPTTSTAAGSRSRHPYTSFDSVTTHRTLHADAGWPEWKFVTHAITTSTIPGGPVGRTLRHRVRGYPVPQVAIIAERRFDPRRTIIFDARDVEGPLVVYDVRVGSTTTTALLASDGPQAFLPLLNAL